MRNFKHFLNLLSQIGHHHHQQDEITSQEQEEKDCIT